MRGMQHPRTPSGCGCMCAVMILHTFGHAKILIPNTAVTSQVNRFSFFSNPWCSSLRRCMLDIKQASLPATTVHMIRTWCFLGLERYGRTPYAPGMRNNNETYRTAVTYCCVYASSTADAAYTILIALTNVNPLVLCTNLHGLSHFWPHTPHLPCHTKRRTTNDAYRVLLSIMAQNDSYDMYG